MITFYRSAWGQSAAFRFKLSPPYLNFQGPGHRPSDNVLQLICQPIAVVPFWRS